jgi:hypothetical protein
MEVGVFLKPAVAGILEPLFVEARLHVDYEENMQRELEMVQSNAQPIFLVLDPNTEEVHARFDGASLLSNDPFIEFLETGLESARPGLSSAAPDGGE